MPHANFPGGLSYTVEAELGRGEAVIREYLRAGLPVVQATRLENFSRFLERDIYLIWGEFRPADLQVPGVIVAEGGVELSYNALPPVPVWPFRPLRPDQVLALALQRFPLGLQRVFDPAEFSRVPVQASLKEELPFGVEGLTLGLEVGSADPRRTGDLEGILELIQAREAWSAGQGEGVVIAVVDSGVEGVPPASREGGWTNLTGGDPWQDEYGHGSMVARIALAVAPRAKILSIKPAPDERGVMSSGSVYLAADWLLGWAIETGKPLVLNNSWGLGGCISVYFPANVLATRVLQKIDRERISLLSWAIGNSRHVCGDSRISAYTLASIPVSMGVGALDRELRPQFYSARGPGPSFPWQPAVCCPTYGVLPWGSGWRDFQEQGGGTSSCAPMVAGALAILRSLYPAASGRELRAALRASANNRLLGYSGALYHPLTGSGLLQIADAVKAVPRARRHPSYFLEGLKWVPNA